MKSKAIFTSLGPEQKYSSIEEQIFNEPLKELATDLNTDISNILRAISILKPERILDMNNKFLPEVRTAIEKALLSPDTSREAPDSIIPRQERRTLQSTPLSARGLSTLHLALNFFEQNINSTPWMGLMVDFLVAFVKDEEHKDDSEDLRIDLLTQTMELFRMLGEVVAIDDVAEWEDYPEFVEQV